MDINAAIRRGLFALGLLALASSPALAECNGLAPPLTICGNTSQTNPGIPQFIPFSSVLGNIPLTNNYVLIGQSNNFASGVPISGDASVTDSGAWTNLKVNGVAYPSSPSNGAAPYVSGTNQVTYGQIPPSGGGTGLDNPTAHSLIVTEGASDFNLLTAATGGRLLLDQGASTDPAFEAMGGDCTIAANGSITCLKTNGTAFTSLATAAPGTNVLAAIEAALNSSTGLVSPNGLSSGACANVIALNSGGAPILSTCPGAATSIQANAGGTSITGSPAAGAFLWNNGGTLYAQQILNSDIVTGSSSGPADSGVTVAHLEAMAAANSDEVGNLPSSIVGTDNAATVTVSNGSAADSTHAVVIISAGYSWAVANGDAINGNQGGSTLSASTTYHFFLCEGSSGVGSFSSTSESSPTCPSGYNSYFRRIFSLNTYAQVTPTTVTISIASPAVISWTSNAMALGQAVVFSTSGSLPTGITAGTTYYVCTVGTNSFEIATSLANALAGTCLDTSGSQSGTQTASPQAFIPGTAIEVNGGGMLFWLAVPTFDIDVTNQGTSQILYTLNVPQGIKVEPIYRAAATSASTQLLFASGDEPNVAPAPLTSSGPWSTFPGFDIGVTSSTYIGSYIGGGFITTNTSGQIGVRANSGSSNTVYEVTRGYVDFRRG